MNVTQMSGKSPRYVRILEPLRGHPNYADAVRRCRVMTETKGLEAGLKVARVIVQAYREAEAIRISLERPTA